MGANKLKIIKIKKTGLKTVTIVNLVSVTLFWRFSINEIILLNDLNTI